MTKVKEDQSKKWKWRFWKTQQLRNQLRMQHQKEAFGKQQQVRNQELRDGLAFKNIVMGWRAKTMYGKISMMNSRDWAWPFSTKTEAENAYHQSWLKKGG